MKLPNCLLVSLIWITTGACGARTGDDLNAYFTAGGGESTGGAPAAGTGATAGRQATGGVATVVTGGRQGTGGRFPLTGGFVATGGSRPTGGSFGVGGSRPTGGSFSPTGGNRPTGGSFSGGGTGGFGGSIATGGTSPLANCLAALSNCLNDPGCAPLILCVLQTGCQGLDCYQPATCQAIIDQFGGLTGTTVQVALSLATCAGA